MGVKKQKQKKIERENLWQKAILIKCYHCLDRNSCKHKNDKQKSEKMGINTYCIFTPNKTKTFIKNGLNKGRKYDKVYR